MIRVTVELIPWGIGKPVLLGVGQISNDCTGTPTIGNYRVRLKSKDGRDWKTAEVHNFPRKKLLAWDLLYRALRETVGYRNPD